MTRYIGHQQDMQWSAIWATTCFWLWRWGDQRIDDPHFVSPLKPWELYYEFPSMLQEHFKKEPSKQFR